MSAPASVVYFMREIRPDAPHEELIKIGYTGLVHERRRQLQSDRGVTLRVLATFPGTRREEQRLHYLFSSARVWPRREWFRPCPEIPAVIDAGTLPALPRIPPRPVVKRRHLLLTLPREDGEEILRLARHAAADEGIRRNTWWFRVIRNALGLLEPEPV